MCVAFFEIKAWEKVASLRTWSACMSGAGCGNGIAGAVDRKIHQVRTIVAREAENSTGEKFTGKIFLDQEFQEDIWPLKLK